MTIAQGQKILAADYNYIAQIVKDILGVGSGTSGYGQQTLTTLITGTPIISHTDWTNLRADMSLVRLHQSGIAIGSEGNNLPTPVAGASITGTDAAAFNSFVQTIYNDRYKVSFNQLTTNGSTTDTSIGPWNGTKTYTYTFTGDTTGSGSADNIRFYFNAGSIIRLNVNIPTVDGNAKQNEWAALLNSKFFFINNTSFRIGTEIFSSSTQLNTYGWYSLTTTDTELYSATCPTFTSNTFKIYAKKTSTSLIVRFEVIDGDISGVDPDITDLTFNSQQFYSSSLNPTFTILPLVKSNTNSGGGLSPKVNSITPNLTSIREGSTVTFTITTSNITTDTTYYWKKTSSSSIPDSRLSVVSGSIIIGSSNTATKSITINTDQNNYVDQTLSIQLYVDSGYTTSLGVASELVTIVGSTKFYSMTTPASITGGDFMSNNTAAQVVEASAGSILTKLQFINNSNVAVRETPATTYPTGTISIAGECETLNSNPNGYIFKTLVPISGSITLDVNDGKTYRTSMVLTNNPGTPYNTFNLNNNFLLTGVGIFTDVNVDPNQNGSYVNSFQMQVFWNEIVDSSQSSISESRVVHSNLQSTSYSILHGDPTLNIVVPSGKTIRSISMSEQSGNYLAAYLTIQTADTVIYNGVSMTISPSSLSSMTVGVAITAVTLSTTGGSSPYTYTVTNGTLPAGLTLSNGIISGTPTTSGAYNFTITSTDSASNTMTQNYLGSVLNNAAPITILPNTMPTFEKDVYISVEITASGGTSPYTFSLISGSLPTGLSFNQPNPGGSGFISGTPTVAGTGNFTIRAIDNVLNSGTLQYSYTVSATSNGSGVLALSPTSISAMTVGTAVNITISASGGTNSVSYTYSMSGLPTGLTYTNEPLYGTATISGTPTTIGTGTFTINVTDTVNNSLTGTRNYSYAVNPGVFSINYPVNLGGPYDTGTAIAPITFTTLNGISPVSYSYTGSLPSGISLSSSGVLSGTPNSVGTYNISVTATDSWSTPRTDTKSYSITTAAPGPLITLTSGDTFLNGETLTFTITGCSPDEYFDIYYGDGTSSHLQFSPAGTYGGSLLINTTAGQHTLSVSPVSGPTPASVNYYVNL